MSERSGRIAVNIFVLLYFTLTLIDALPSVSQSHERLKTALVPILDGSGLWQGTWDLYAPEADKINIRVSARFQFVDGEIGRWVSPDWTKMSVWQRMLSFREMEFIDSIRRDSNRSAWESLADYLVREQMRQGKKVKQVVLTRHWALLKPPNVEFIPFPFFLPFRNEARFYEKNYAS